jgi:hypothetical protein
VRNGLTDEGVGVRHSGDILRRECGQVNEGQAGEARMDKARTNAK